MTIQNHVLHDIPLIRDLQTFQQVMTSTYAVTLFMLQQTKYCHMHMFQTVILVDQNHQHTQEWLCTVV